MSIAISAGEVWESRDPRDNGRRVRVLYGTNPGEWNPHVTVENIVTGRRSQVRGLTLLRRFRCVKDSQ